MGTLDKEMILVYRVSARYGWSLHVWLCRYAVCGEKWREVTRYDADER